MSDSQSYEAVILAGGLGTRLRPYTRHIPKPLVSIHGIPVIEIVLRRLAHSGIRNVAITLGHEADLIRAHIGDGSYLNLNIGYVEEEKPLGTAGPLAQVPNLAESFLVLNGDLLTDLDFSTFKGKHQQNSSILTISTYQRTIPVEFGVLRYNEDNIVNDYIEKPNLVYVVSMGVYAFDRAIIKYITPGERLDFPDLVHKLLAAGESISHELFDGYWLDIGSGADFEKALEDFPKLRDRLLNTKP